MSLKELTKDNHSNAERQEFVKILFSGSIDPKLYATYLYNQFPMYELLEVCAMPHGLLSDIPGILRAKSIRKDFEELWGSDEDDRPKLCPVVKAYMDHIMNIKDEPRKLMAHIYVRHMGDLAGGQMIAKKVPGAGKYYQFENADDLKAAVRLKVDDGMADEAKVCFDFATQFFKEMMEIANINK
jgi:heme oxygenase